VEEFRHTWEEICFRNINSLKVLDRCGLEKFLLEISGKV